MMNSNDDIWIAEVENLALLGTGYSIRIIVRPQFSGGSFSNTVIMGFWVPEV